MRLRAGLLACVLLIIAASFAVLSARSRPLHPEELRRELYLVIHDMENPGNWEILPQPNRTKGEFVIFRDETGGLEKARVLVWRQSSGEIAVRIWPDPATSYTIDGGACALSREPCGVLHKREWQAVYLRFVLLADTYAIRL